MKILHLTDFHYSDKSKHAFDQNNIVVNLINDLKQKNNIDFVFFTGDLVYSGEKYENFIAAKNLLLNGIADSLNIDKGNIFICGGNHDVNRKQELEDTTDKIKEIDSIDDLEEFITKQDGKSFEESLKNLGNFNKFIKDFYSEFGIENSFELTELYTIHKINFKNHKLGILTINSSWRAIDSDTDRGNLLFPISILKNAINKLNKECDFKIALMHHPISDFKEWNASQIEDLIFKDFHLLFSGHLHKKKQQIQICTDEGIFCCSAQATLTNEGHNIGYTIIDVDIDTYELEIFNSYYQPQESKFLSLNDSIKANIPAGAVKNEANQFRKTLRKKYHEELDRANELFISFEDNNNSNSFLDLFSNPILKHKTKAQIAESKTDSPSIIIGDILDSTESFVLIGKDKSGRTSILYKILLDLINDFSIYKTVPLILNAKEYNNLTKPLDIYKKISRYYELSYNNAMMLPNKYSLRLLIDNYEPSNTAFNEVITNFIKAHPTVSFIVTSEEKLATTFTSFDFDGKKYSTLYIHEISRPEVRLLANKWPNLTKEKRELVLEKIFGIFTQLNIPTNYWTVSLFLWIFEKNNDANFHNSFELIQLYIDNLLDRKRLALDKTSKLKFDDFKTYLGELAYFLLYERINIGYTATYKELVDFTTGYRMKNKRFVIEVKDVIDIIIEKNILRKVDDDSYTFRLNGVFEYFIALYMTKDEKFTDRIITDDHFYLSFKNELELYSGFKKNSKEYLEKIFNRTKIIFKNLNEKYNGTDIDSQLLLKISDAFNLAIPVHELKNSISKSLPVEKQDELLSEFSPVDIQKTDVKPKQYYEKIEDTSDNLEKSLHILARVFRNSDIEDEQLTNQVLDYILTSACQLGFKLIDDIEEGEDNFIDIDEESEKFMVQLLTNFMPLIVQTFLYDAIAQNDLERIFLEKIEELKRDKRGNQFKLLLLYFTLIDLDLNTNKELIKEVIELIDINTLKHTTILKLYYYLMFKCSGKPHLETFIKEQIQEQTLKINPETDKGKLQKGLTKTARISRLRNSSKGKN